MAFETHNLTYLNCILVFFIFYFVATRNCCALFPPLLQVYVCEGTMVSKWVKLLNVYTQADGRTGGQTERHIFWDKDFVFSWMFKLYLLYKHYSLNKYVKALFCFFFFGIIQIVLPKFFSTKLVGVLYA